MEKLTTRYSRLRRCAEVAPVGTYADVKDACEAIGDAADCIITTLRAHGFKLGRTDTLYGIEAAIYGYLLEGNPNAFGLITGEGFGEHVDGPAGKRILAQLVRDRDSLAARA